MYLPGFVNLVVEYWRKLHTLQIFSHKFTFLSEKNINFNKHLQLLKCDQIPHKQMSWYINIV